MDSLDAGAKGRVSGESGGSFVTAEGGFLQADSVDAPTVEEAPIHLECRVLDILRVPPVRTLFVAEVVATTALEGAVDDDGRLVVVNTPFFGMTAGSGEHWTMGQKVGHIGMTVGRDEIRY